MSTTKTSSDLKAPYPSTTNSTFSPNASIQLLEDATVTSLLPQGHEKGASEEITPVRTEELLTQVSAHAGAPSQTLVLKDHPTGSQGGRVQSRNVEAGPSTSFLGKTRIQVGSRECHGFMNPCRLVLRVTAGAGMGCEFATLTQPVPATHV